MLKLVASYSKKVPADGEYTSQSYHCSMEVELSDALEPAQIRERIHTTFAQVREAVEAELHENSAPAPIPFGTRSKANGDRGERRPNGNGKASNRQLKYLLDLANERGIELSRLNGRLAERYGVDSVYALTRDQASQVLDDLKSVRRQQAAA